MKTILHAADRRGHVSFGWLDSHHSFSFGNYYDPEKVHFGMLRVLNDDVISGGSGFGTHSHDNMEIISIPLEGAIEHKDSMGTQAVINENDVQIMSAGTGIKHSEYNHHKDREANFLQIWIMPKEQNIKPRYDQRTFSTTERINQFQTVVAPDNDKAVWINQDAWVSLGSLKGGFSTSYTIKKSGNGVYAFVLNGSVTLNEQTLFKRDAMGIWEVDKIEIEATTDSELLLIDVPMVA
ncbi:pirin family protein [Segetibacter sp.]|jgi:redox-sensitive bicupin YhaK (pirin superfamily)|uniref:pirin family protein n=1 Tax=Segetibacter sp. TaxID=2231182 RepID=UPI0026235C20|nr:pirin family protein [Segetibacter sp.]MCW3080685.1 pirin family protein [Segetibacter sp.]